jgi:hypothetical protein
MLIMLLSVAVIFAMMSAASSNSTSSTLLRDTLGARGLYELSKYLISQCTWPQMAIITA